MKAIVLITVVMFLSGLFFFSVRPVGSPLFDFDTPSPTPKPTAGIEIQYNGKIYFVNYFEVKDHAKLFLFPNFEEKKNASALVGESNCKALISGGFYTPENKPTGLFIHKGAMLRDRNVSDLLNGIVGVTFGEKAFIGTKYPVGSTRIALQSGPLLISANKPQSLGLKNDSNDRRMVAALTADNSLVFMAFYSDVSRFGGPLLEELPEIVSAFAKQKNFEFSDAINLDGGTASAFESDEIVLSELAPVGSYFCVIN